jgi:hypothetical protein
MLCILGNFPKVMNIGVVNDESDCLLLSTNNDQCLEKDLSCHLIQEFCDPLNAIQYNSTAEALQSSRWDNVYMVYHFKENFSSNIIEIFNSEYRGLTDLDIHLTSENPMFIHHICSKFEDAFNILLDRIARSCNISEKLSKIQIIESFGLQKGNFLNDSLPTTIIM